MGIESDQLVYDYLSRVGDLAQATTLTAAERARLVSGLRQAIDGRRGEAAAGSQRTEQAAVRKILSGIGTPADVVRQAVHGGVPSMPEAAPPGAAFAGGTSGGASGSVSAEGAGSSTRTTGRLRRTARALGRTSGPSVPRQGGAAPAGYDSAPGPDGGSDLGGYAYGDGSGAGGPEDWWRTADEFSEGGPGGLSGLDGESIGELPGWRAVYEPDFLDPELAERGVRVPAQRQAPRDAGTDEREDDEDDEDGAGYADGAEVPGGGPDGAGAAPVRRFLRLRRGGPAAVPAPQEFVQQVVPRGPLPLVETLAVLVLAAAAALGLWYVAVLGWFLAYTSRRLGQRVAHAAGLWLPLLLAAVCGFTLYSHVHGQPAGHPESNAAFTAALHSAVSLWLRLAAGTSAAFLAWQINRRR